MTARPVTERLKVLVADDDPIARRVVCGALRSRFEVIEAVDGIMAVELFHEKTPDFVLLDVDMPGKTGVEAAEEMRVQAKDRFVPILLLSALDQVSTLVEGLSRGADDFLPKPFNARVFDSKLSVFLRIRDMQTRLLSQNAELASYREHTEAEHVLAQEVFGRILERGAGSDGRVRVSASPLAMFNGDVVLTARTPSGKFRWLLGDVAGHGLSGAIGTVPLANEFYRAARRDVELATMVATIGEELNATLPSRLFCATCAFELDEARSELTVINCGTPDAWVLSGGELRCFTSQNLPLGILRRVDPVAERMKVEPGARVLAMSDGIVECTAPDGQMFGVDRLKQALTGGPPSAAFDAVLTAIKSFSAGTQSDDVTLVEVLV